MVHLQRNNYLGTNSKTQTIEGVIINQTEYGNTVYDDWHSHENNHITFVLKGGSREVHKNGYSFTEAPGQLTFYRKNEVHKNIDTTPQTRVINVEIEDDFMDRYNIGISTFNPQTLNTPDEKFKFLKLYRETEYLDNHSATSIHFLLLELLNRDNQKDCAKPDWIIKLIELLNDCWNEDLNLTEISRIINIHPVTISKYFPKYFQCTFGEYVRNIRVEKAMMLIKTTNLSFTDIAYSCAFYDQSHFIRHFKKCTGFLPNEFRKC